jgi:UDP-galactopyranose mutase
MSHLDGCKRLLRVLAIEYVSAGCRAEIHKLVYLYFKYAKYKYRVLLARIKATWTLPHSFIVLKAFLGKRFTQSQTLKFDTTKFCFFSTFTERIEDAKEDRASDIPCSPRTLQKVIMTSTTGAVLNPNNTYT